MSWPGLPAEIRRHILEQLFNAARAHGEPLSGYTVVSLEFQAFLEGRLYYSLDVRPRELGTFMAVFNKVYRRKYVQRLGLVLNLPCQTIPSPIGWQSHMPEHRPLLLMLLIYTGGPDRRPILPGLRAQQRLDNSIFITGVRSLFRLLATWTREQVTSRGILLEIIADAKSYWQTMGENMQRLNGPRRIHSTQIVDGRLMSASIDIPPREWQRTLKAAELDFHFELGLYGGSRGKGKDEDEDEDEDKERGRRWRPRRREPPFPKVRVVTALTIRRRTIRRFHPKAVQAIVQSLPCLEDLDWHIRPYPTLSIYRTFEQDLNRVLLVLPSSMQQVHVTQVHDYVLEQGETNVDYQRADAVFRYIWRTKLSQLQGLSLEYKARTLESEMKHSATLWPNLERLVLRPRGSISNHAPTEDFNRLMQNAAQVVRRMPKLRFLMIYDTTGLTMGCLVCRILESSLAIGIKCSWRCHINTATMEAWDVTAGARRLYDIG
ncbi:uncharacterized protein MAM_07188 [Metarhizium album ARSEF 1941]|uniref:DUF6546 domain-containing protein n=1 Tax=Metarhizium album (strain ARSEF 1941) TaxID=1081103 RepID=A0A0B2WG44_METAS|nr:uncharacterized protein MAM_07188 [Metarhizium album ARSEF 1941]KHN94961.1 hypothetical protein MAM_07188 [Metarhizium album ARSEF 1941]